MLIRELMSTSMRNTSNSYKRSGVLKRNATLISAGLFQLCLSGCESTVYWQNLPAPPSSRVASVKGDSEVVARAVAITRKLVDVKPLPASRVFVMTNEFKFTAHKLAQIPDRAHAMRCPVKGEERKDTLPPSAACIWLPGSHVDRLSDEALAAIIAHELGHIEKGHKTWTGAAEPLALQWEADEAAVHRLYLAGYCAGEAMRKYAAELVSAYAGRLVHPWRDYPRDCGPKAASTVLETQIPFK
jgi:hypothetical protein